MRGGFKLPEEAIFGRLSVETWREGGERGSEAIKGAKLGKTQTFDKGKSNVFGMKQAGPDLVRVLWKRKSRPRLKGRSGKVRLKWGGGCLKKKLQWR